MFLEDEIKNFVTVSRAVIFTPILIFCIGWASAIPFMLGSVLSICLQKINRKANLEKIENEAKE